ncbi:MAG TPA: PQQ-binding-like beta-propeller repeat protein [Acidimicrobiales bacterium]|nr:PQQ-binding-like beta-propeller repeat protein [Acidimicrobiales bacterium]
MFRRATALAVLSAAAVVPPLVGRAGGAHAASSLRVTLVWQKTLPGSPIRFSSPVTANLDSAGPSAVVGSLDGKLWAFHLSDGSSAPGWPAQLDFGVDATPSATRLPATGADTVFVGTGTEENVKPGGMWALSADGSARWHFAGPANMPTQAVSTAMSVVPLTCNGRASVVSGSFGDFSYALDAADGSPLSGWPVINYDTVWSSPAVYPGGGQNVVIEGDDSTTPQGGWVRAVSGTGATLWRDFFDDVTTSSPAVGPVTPGGPPMIAVGHGFYWTQASGAPRSSSTQVTLIDPATGRVAWSKDVGGYTRNSPALADLTGNGVADIVEGTQGTPSEPNAGMIWALDGSGNPLPNWPAPTPPGVGAVYGSVTTADLSGAGYQDVIVPTGDGAYVYDGRSASVVASLAVNQVGLGNSPLVTRDPNGTVGITLAGTNHNGDGVVFHYEVAGGQLGATGWPMFHHDPASSGSLQPPVASPSGCGSWAAGGYRLVASDGGIFDFGDAAFYGSAGGSPLPAPIVGMQPTPDDHGYWMVGRGGNIYHFGDAGFFGDHAGSGITAVGMAATPDGAGYWIVDNRGGVYTFGSAGYYGGRVGVPDVVGMARTPDGHGYWLVTNAGEVLPFGDAGRYGDVSGLHLAAPVVGINATPDGRGYWLLGADGGIFTFGDARFLGSTGAMRLNKPVVGMTPTPSGNGYWLVATDGGIFTFGDAGFFGSTGGIRLNQPVFAMTDG